MGLTNAPASFSVEFQQELKDGLRSIPGIEILDFIGLEGGTQGQVYEYDRACTEKADLCVFIADYPSIGLGMEIVFRYFCGQPMLVFAHYDKKVTRMLTGMCEVEADTMHFSLYNTVEDIIRSVEEYLRADLLVK